MKKTTDLAAEARSCIANLDFAGVDKEQADGEAATVARWSVGGIFLEALANRDYARLATTLGSAVRFRALLPPGPMAWEGSEAATKAFSSWFGQADELHGAIHYLLADASKFVTGTILAVDGGFIAFSGV